MFYVCVCAFMSQMGEIVLVKCVLVELGSLGYLRANNTLHYCHLSFNYSLPLVGPYHQVCGAN